MSQLSKHHAVISHVLVRSTGIGKPDSRLAHNLNDARSPGQ